MSTSALTRGQLVARRRTAAGFSQEDLARRCQCSTRTIMRIEAGTSPAMSQRIRNALHEALGISLRQLANGQRAGKGA